MSDFQAALTYLDEVEREVKRHAYREEMFKRVREVIARLANIEGQVAAFEVKRKEAEKSVLDAWDSADKKINEAKAHVDEVQLVSQQKISALKAAEEDARQRKVEAEKTTASRLRELVEIEQRAEQQHSRLIDALAAEEKEARGKLASVKAELDKLGALITKVRG